MLSLTLDQVEPVYRWSALRSAHSLWRLGTLGVSWAAGASAPYVCAVEIDSTPIHGVAGRPGDCISLVTSHPFPAPHHTISNVTLIEDGHIPMLGAESLAHHGMLLLGELPELRRQVLESLR